MGRGVGSARCVESTPTSRASLQISLPVGSCVWLSAEMLPLLLMLLQLLRNLFRDLGTQIGQHFVDNIGNGLGIVGGSLRRFLSARALLRTGGSRHGSSVRGQFGVFFVIIVLLARLRRACRLGLIARLANLPPACPRSRGGRSYVTLSLFRHFPSCNFSISLLRSIGHCGNRCL